MGPIKCSMLLSPLPRSLPCSNNNHQNLRLLHYPACEKAEINEKDALGQKRAGVHTDYGTITLLAQEAVGGLQVQRRDGEWLFVPPVKNALVVNVGDCLMRWSDDYLVSTPHRVIADPSIKTGMVPERFSIAFFCNANKDTLIECLPFLKKPGVAPKYPPINAFDYLKGRLDDTI